HGDGCSPHSERPLDYSPGMPDEGAGTPSKEGGRPSEQHGTPYANVGTLYPNVGMLSLFGGTPCELYEEICEESRAPRALPALPDRSRREPWRRAKRPSARRATRRMHVGMLSWRVEMLSAHGETPGEERAMPAV